MPGSFDLYVNMLFTYQGMGNLVTITKPGDPSVVYANALIDFGSTAKTYCKQTVAWLHGYLTQNGTRPAELDLVTVSHKDNDHWSLFPPLLEALKKSKSKFTIDRLVIGDQPNRYDQLSTKNKNTIVDELYSYLNLHAPEPFKFYPDSDSSAYAPFKPLAPIRTYSPPGGPAEIKIVPVAANVATSSTKEDIRANTVSLVIAIVYQGKAILLPGDATADTIRYINNLVQLNLANEIKGPRMLSVPHHGSLRTIAANFETSNPNLALARQFAALISPMTVGASAGFVTHNHPHIQVIELFKNSYNQKAWTDHPFVAYYNDTDRWKVAKTQNGVYTNYLSVGSDGKKVGAQTARIVFRIRANGDFDIAVLSPPGQGGIGALPRNE